MSPRSLLFCSSRETSRLLSSFLRELHFEVEQCPEIFDAVKRLTSHPHEVVVIDWDEGLEAGFLLKTVRELKSNREAFVIALAKADAVAAVRQAGANEVVVKPPANAGSNNLISSRDFLTGLERHLAVARKAPTAKPAVHVISTVPSYAPPAHAVKPPAAASRYSSGRRIGENRAPVSLTFASVEGGLFSKEGLLKLFPTRGARVAPPRKGSARNRARNNDRRNAWLRRAAMVVAFFSVGYVASQPLSQGGAFVAELYQQAWGINPTIRHVPRIEARPQAEIAQASVAVSEPADPPDQPSTSMQVSVTPLYHDPSRHDPLNHDPLNHDPLRSGKTASEPRQPIETAPPDQLPAMASAATGIHIPDSMSNPFPGATTVRNVADRISPAILGALEPVTLPAYLSERLLVDRVEPSYPERALQAGLQGPVVLQAFIGRDGKVRDLKLIRGPLLLGQAAYKAVKQWRYQPYLMNGEAVEAQTYVTVDFKLP